jgi:hypothetical protein
MENVGRCGPNSTGSAYVTEVGSRDYGNTISGSIKKTMKSVDQLSDN